MAMRVVRSWAGVTSSDHAAAYLAHLREETIPHLQALPGFEGIRVLRRVSEGDEYVRVQTTWQTMDSIRAFAGEDLEVAVVPPAARALLKSFDAHVEHYEVVIE